MVATHNEAMRNQTPPVWVERDTSFGRPTGLVADSTEPTWLHRKCREICEATGDRIPLVVKDLTDRPTGFTVETLRSTVVQTRLERGH